MPGRANIAPSTSRRRARGVSSLWPLLALTIVSPGCYLSHRLADDRDAGPRPADASPADGGGLESSELPPRRLAVGGDGHVCFVRDDGRVACWGHNDHGQLGDGTRTDRTSPVDVIGLDDVVEVAVGVSHSCARRRDGSVACWGRNLWGEVGDGTRERRTEPRDLEGVRATRIAAGYTSTFAIQVDGTVLAWGFNRFGQLGDGTTLDRDLPVEVVGLRDVVSLATSLWHSCASRRNGTVACWGDNEYAQLGDGTTDTRWEPADVPGLDDVEQVTTGYGFSCVRRSEGRVWCWGWNESGQLGDGTTAVGSTGPSLYRAELSPTASFPSATHIEASRPMACAIDVDRSLWCWGMVTIPSVAVPRPVRIEGLGPVLEVGVGDWDICALQTDDQIRCWGINQWGAAGDGSTRNRATPVTVSGL